MITGNSHLFREDLSWDLRLRRRSYDSYFTGDASFAPTGSRQEPGTGGASDRCEQSLRLGNALPLRRLEPHNLDDVFDDVDDYAARVQGSSTIEAVFDIVIATAEMRAGSAVVRDVLISLASSRDGRTLADLAGDDDDHAISVMHVLAILGNHLHTRNERFSLTPYLHIAVERRYPLGRLDVRTRPTIPSAASNALRFNLVESA